jgi:hypothetical protein
MGKSRTSLDDFTKEYMVKNLLSMTEFTNAFTVAVYKENFSRYKTISLINKLKTLDKNFYKYYVKTIRHFDYFNGIAYMYLEKIEAVCKDLNILSEIYELRVSSFNYLAGTIKLLMFKNDEFSHRVLLRLGDDFNSAMIEFDSAINTIKEKSVRDLLKKKRLNAKKFVATLVSKLNRNILNSNHSKRVDLMLMAGNILSGMNIIKDFDNKTLYDELLITYNSTILWATGPSRI